MRKLARMPVEDERSPALRRLLLTVRALLKAQVHIQPSGTPTQPVRLEDGTMGFSWLQCRNAFMLTAMGTTTSIGAIHVRLWADSCTCPHRKVRRPCKHIIACRVLWLRCGGRRFWGDAEEQAFFAPVTEPPEPSMHTHSEAGGAAGGAGMVVPTVGDISEDAALASIEEDLRTLQLSVPDVKDALTAAAAEASEASGPRTTKLRALNGLYRAMRSAVHYAGSIVGSAATSIIGRREMPDSMPSASAQAAARRVAVRSAVPVHAIQYGGGGAAAGPSASLSAGAAARIVGAGSSDAASMTATGMAAKRKRVHHPDPAHDEQ